MLSMLSNNSADHILTFFFFFFLRKGALTVHANCLISGLIRPFCMKCQNLYFEKNKKSINFLSAELALRVVKVKGSGYTY